MTRERGVLQKSERLIRTGRCHPIRVVPGECWVGVIDGDTGRYLVTAVTGAALDRATDETDALVPLASCTCYRARELGRACSHAFAALTLLTAVTEISAPDTATAAGEGGRRGTRTRVSGLGDSCAAGSVPG